MSINITTSFVEQYSSNVNLLSQQMGSKLRSSVDEESIVGKNAFFEQISATAAVLRTSRHSIHLKSILHIAEEELVFQTTNGQT